MPRQLVTLIYCDVCNGDVEEDKPQPLSLGRKQAEPDLCPKCKQELEDFLEPYLKKPTKKPATSSPAADDEPHEVGPCGVEGCDKMAKSEGGMNLHKRRAHNVGPEA